MDSVNSFEPTVNCAPSAHRRWVTPPRHHHSRHRRVPRRLAHTATGRSLQALPISIKLLDPQDPSGAALVPQIPVDSAK